MQIFKQEHALMLVEQIQAMTSVMLHALINAGLDLVSSTFASIFTALHAHEWTAAAIGTITLAGIIVFILRLVRHNFSDLL